MNSSVKENLKEEISRIFHWHYVEYFNYGYNDGEWQNWLDNFVGLHGVDWRWDNHPNNYYFVCFKREEDATAFKLKFKLA